MNNMVVLPILLPLLTGTILILFRKKILLQRVLSVASIFGMIASSVYLIGQIKYEGIQTLYVGGWAPPYGITLVADMFAALLVLTTAIVGLCCLWFSFRSIGSERENHYYYSFFQFLLVGVCGSFLTGDIFNLFVFFEVMLIASYIMLALGGEKRQLRETIKYMLVNIVSSTLFVSTIAFLYSVVGTLNMADISYRVAQVGQTGILNVIAALLLFVFSLKAGLFLYFWLPGSYSAPPPAIAALFAALLTKVGIYAIFRMFTLIFYHDPSFTHSMIAWLAGATMIAGAIGCVAFNDVKQILVYNVILAVGVILFGLATMNATAIEGAIFYLLHDMIIKAVLFLLGGALITVAGTSRLRQMSGMIHQHPLLGWLFFIATIALAGVPPLSGFAGKWLLTLGGLEANFYWLVGISLVTSLFVLYSVMKIFITGFWGEAIPSSVEQKNKSRGLLTPCAILIGISVLMGLGTEFIFPYIQVAAETLMDPSIYIQAVLKE